MRTRRGSRCPDERGNFRATESSAWIRTRLRVKDMTDPLAAVDGTSAARRAVAMLRALGVWMLGDEAKLECELE